MILNTKINILFSLCHFCPLCYVGNFFFWNPCSLIWFVKKNIIRATFLPSCLKCFIDNHMIRFAFYDRFIFSLFVENSWTRNLLILATVAVWAHKLLIGDHVDAETETGVNFSLTNWSRRGTQCWTYLGVELFCKK